MLRPRGHNFGHGVVLVATGLGFNWLVSTSNSMSFNYRTDDLSYDDYPVVKEQACMYCRCPRRFLANKPATPKLLPRHPQNEAHNTV